MKAITTFHAPSSVVASFKARLVPHVKREFLVAARVDRIEIWSLNEEGMRHECTQEIWGRVVSLKELPIKGASHSRILVLTDHPEPELILFSYVPEKNPQPPSLKSEHALALHERTSRPAEYLTDVIVDRTGSVAVASVYAGKLKIVRFGDGGKVESDFDVSMREYTLLSLDFLYTASPEEGIFTLAILHYAYTQAIHVLARDLDLENYELSHAPSIAFTPTALSERIVPFPLDNPPRITTVANGVLVLGGRRILYYAMASPEAQEKQAGKARRNEARKSKGKKDAEKAREKERERAGRKRKANAGVEWPWGEVTAHCIIDEGRIVVGDAFGKLAVLSVAALDTMGLVLVPLGEASAPTTLTYLAAQHLFLGSHFGDSALLRLHTTPHSALDAPTLPIPPSIETLSASALAVKFGEMDVDKEKGFIVESKGSLVEVVDRWRNIAPIVDGIVVDMDGQREVVTCSGGKNTGALNVVRNGASFHEIAVIAGASDVVGVWALRNEYEDTTDAHIVLSTLSSTDVLRIDDPRSVARVEHTVGTFATQFRTLFCTNVRRRASTRQGAAPSFVDAPLAVQVTPTGVYVLEYNAGLMEWAREGGWRPQEVPHTNPRVVATREIVTAAVCGGWVVLALTGGVVVVASVGDAGAFKVERTGQLGNAIRPEEISAIACTSMPGSAYPLIATAFWGSNTVSMWIPPSSSDGLQSLGKTVALSGHARSLLLHKPDTANEQMNILAGLADGTIISLPFNVKDRTFVGSSDVVRLGETSVSLLDCEVDGRKAVLACGSRAAVLFWERGRLKHSPVGLKDVASACRFSSPPYQNCLLLATASGLSIGMVEDVDKMHVQSIPLGLDNPRRLKHHEKLKMFGVACSRQTPGRVGDPETCQSFVSFYNTDTLTVSSQFEFDVDHEVTALDTVNTPKLAGFVVGTVCFEDAEDEPREGRLSLLRAGPKRDAGPRLMSLAASAEVSGCVYALAKTDDGKIVAAVNTSVIVFAATLDDHNQARLKKVAEWNHNYIVLSLAARGNRIVVGDAITSVSVLELQPGGRLVNVAKDYGPLWPVCVETLGDRSLIGANSDLNVFTFTLLQREGRTVLDRDGLYFIGDMVNKFVQGSVTAPDDADASLRPEQLLFTSSGRISVVLDVGAELALQLTALQRNLGGVVSGPGTLTHAQLRAPKNSKGRTDAQTAAFGFLDGDFLETFLALVQSDRARFEKVLGGHNEAERLTMPVAEMVRVLERMQSMH